MNAPNVKGFFDPETWTLTYVVSDAKTKDAVVIDPVLDFDALSAQTFTRSADEVARYVEAEGLHLRAILETHAHADHISGARYLAAKYKVPVVIGESITVVQETFKKFFGFSDAVRTDGSQFDRLLSAGEIAHFGSLAVKALPTPGHTPACMSYLIGDAVFTGDALFMEDYGTGRTDFPAGSADALYDSVTQVLYELPAETRVFVGHDYLPGGRELKFETDIATQRERNVQLPARKTKEQFVEFRNQRDSQLKPPRLIYQSIQINVFGGYLPDEEANGRRYLKMPLNARVRTDNSGTPLS